MNKFERVAGYPSDFGNWDQITWEESGRVNVAPKCKAETCMCYDTGNFALQRVELGYRRFNCAMDARDKTSSVY